MPDTSQIVTKHVNEEALNHTYQKKYKIDFTIYEGLLIYMDEKDDSHTAITKI
jgi:hypothetical protein